MAIFSIYFISCTTSRKNYVEIPVQESYKNNPYAQPYIGPYLISERQAMIYIHAFKKHNYRVTRKKRLDPAWSFFDQKILKDLMLDKKTDSVIFLFGAYPSWDTTIPKEKKRHPFIILQAIPKVVFNESGKGDSFSSEALSASLYFRPKDICPPPNTGCKIP